MLFVRIGGIDQWITIRGQDRDKPVVVAASVALLHPAAFLGATLPLHLTYSPKRLSQERLLGTPSTQSSKAGRAKPLDREIEAMVSIRYLDGEAKHENEFRGGFAARSISNGGIVWICADVVGAARPHSSKYRLANT